MRKAIILLPLILLGMSANAQRVVDYKGTKQSADTTNDSWKDDAANKQISLAYKADGTTVRPADSAVVITDDGRLGIGTINPNADAVLDLSSAGKGALIPRIALTSTTAATPLSAHVAGMIVYNTATAGSAPNNVIPGFYYNDGSVWKNLKPIETTHDLKDGYVDSNYNFGLGGYKNSSSAYKPLGNITTGFNNMAIGYNALSVNSTGEDNIAIGKNALKANISGVANTVLGAEAMGLSTTGNYNTAVGRWSLMKLTNSRDNTALGYYAGAAVTTGSYNTLLGRQAGVNDGGVGLSTGNGNTVVGCETAIGLTTGSYNTILGAGVTGLNASLNNNIILADGQGNRRINVDSLGRTGVGLTNATQMLVVKGLNDAPYAGAAQTQSNAIFRVQGSSNHSLDFGTMAAIPYGSYIQSYGFASTTGLPLSLNPTGGYVGIGIQAPTAKLHVAGQVKADSTITAPNYAATVQTTATGNAYTWDLNLGANTAWTLAASANTLTITNAKAGMFGLIRVINSGTSTITLPAGSKVINGGAGVVPLTLTASAVDILTFYYDGTNYWWTYGNNYN